MRKLFKQLSFILSLQFSQNKHLQLKYFVVVVLQIYYRSNDMYNNWFLNISYITNKNIFI